MRFRFGNPFEESGLGYGFGILIWIQLLDSGLGLKLVWDSCMFGVPLMRFMFKIQVWDSDFGSRFVIQVWDSGLDSGLGFKFGIQVWDSFCGIKFGIRVWDSGLGFRFWSQVCD